MLDRLRLRDAGAWERLVQLMGPVVYQWCRGAQLQGVDAADVVQDVFQAVMTHLDHFRRDSPGDTFRGWLWTITRNRIRDHFRARKAQPEAFGGSDANRRFQELAEDVSGSHDPAAVDADCLIARRALELIRGDFGESTWQAFWRMAIKGQSSAEVAADLGMSQEAVRRAKCRVLRRFRDEIEGLL